MKHAFAAPALLLWILMLGACRGTGSTPGPDAVTTESAARDEGYALLYGTLRDEADVDKLLIIKRPNAAVTAIIKEIAQFSRDTQKTMENLAKEPPAIGLEHQNLPEAESRTRDAISSATAKQLIFHGGKELEFRLLLTQYEALNYVTHLASTVEAGETRDNRKRFLAQVSRHADELRERVLALLKAEYVGTSK